MALAHNGNLTNSQRAARESWKLEGSIFHTTSDTEVIAYIITQERLSAPSIEEAVNRRHGHARGGLLPGDHRPPRKLIAARDPHGFRPLCIGQTADGR